MENNKQSRSGDKLTGRAGEIPAKKEGRIPPAVIDRLPRYFRSLRTLLVNGIVRTSSAELASALKMTAAQVRSDLNFFGNLGQQGYGYNVKQLYTEISRMLGAGEGYRAILICADCFGIGFFDDRLFEGRGVTLTAAFTEGGSLPQDGLPVYPVEKLEEYLTSEGAEIAVLGPRCPDAQAMYARVAKCGVRGVWNFTGELLESRNGVSVKNLVIGDSLMTLCYAIRRAKLGGEAPEGGGGQTE